MIAPDSLVFRSRRYIPQAETPEPAFYRVRCPHDTERVNINQGRDEYIPASTTPTARGVVRQSVLDKGAPLPEVYRFSPAHSVLLTKPLQLLWKAINPELSNEKWRSLLGSALAFTNNGTGFATPHADYVNNRDLNYKPPSFDQSRFCGGAEFRATRRDGLAIIESIRTDRPLPTAQQLLDSPWLWFWGTSIAPNGNIYYMRKKSVSGDLIKIRVPLFTELEIYLPWSWVHVLQDGETYAAHEVVYKG